MSDVVFAGSSRTSPASGLTWVSVSEGYLAQFLHAECSSSGQMGPAYRVSTRQAHQVSMHLDRLVTTTLMFLFVRFTSMAVHSQPSPHVVVSPWVPWRGPPHRKRSSSLTAITDAAGNTSAVVGNGFAIVFSRTFFLVAP